MENVFEFYASVKEQKVEWLWYPYIPYGKLTLLEGDPGEGKSTFMLHIATRLTRGQDMPDGFKVEKPEYVIYQCNEDDVADTILQKIQELGVSERTLYSPKKEPGIKSFRKKGVWYWQLPDTYTNIINI